MSYDIKPLKAPRTAGTALKILATLAETPGIGSILGHVMLKNAGILDFRKIATDEALPIHPPDMPLAGPSTPQPGKAFDTEKLPQDEDFRCPDGFRFKTALDFAKAYHDGQVTPEDVAKEIIHLTEESEHRTPPMRFFISQRADDLLSQAKAATERIKAGKVLSVLDGVPVAVKDELDMKPYPTTVGTRFLGQEAVSEDAEVIARLRNAGALLIGKANMHEIGIGVTGLNPHHGAARNPYNPAHATGGSSSGAAAVVAGGLCPIAVGADGGGSIRIPSSFCGVVGLKPTYGRMSEHGAAPLCWSLAHVGPIGATVIDVALAYAIMAGSDPKDPNSLHQPAVTLEGLTEQNLSGKVFGVYRPWFEDADREVVEACQSMLTKLEQAGAKIRNIEIPDLGLARTVHLVTIVSEMATAHLQHYEKHRQEYGYDTRLNLKIGRSLRTYDYVHAQRHRITICRTFNAIMKEVDAIVTPSTACTAPVLPLDAMETGESNLAMTAKIMRFAPVPNLTGFPAITFPAGYDSQGLPIGFQVIGRAWEESFLLRVAAIAERTTERTEPQVHYKLKH